MQGVGLECLVGDAAKQVVSCGHSAERLALLEKLSRLVLEFWVDSFRCRVWRSRFQLIWSSWFMVWDCEEIIQGEVCKSHRRTTRDPISRGKSIRYPVVIPKEHPLIF